MITLHYTRFDTGRPEGVGVATSVAKPVGLMSNLPAVSKTTIDAFGSLVKRPKI